MPATIAVGSTVTLCLGGHELGGMSPEIKLGCPCGYIVMTDATVPVSPA